MRCRVNFRGNVFSHQSLSYGLVILLALCTSYIGLYHQQNDFFRFFPILSIAFLAYFGICKLNLSVVHLFVFSIIVRLGLVFAFPFLSDDVYRFYWDGRLILSGVSPYGLLPSDAVHMDIPTLDRTLFDQLNSPNFYTVYPPINQIYFALSSLAGDIFSTAFLMKMLFIITEMVGLYYMVRIFTIQKTSINRTALYIFNPLVIVEGVGNLHFEVIVVSFISISIYYIINNKIILGSFFLAISIGMKLLPLMLLPYFWFKWKGKTQWKFFIVLATTLFLIFLPILNSIDLPSFLSSVDLYFRKFEFNASVYYILRYIGQQISGYNLIQYIGPSLAIITLGCNIYQAKKHASLENFRNIFNYALWIWTIYLFLATTVHPWYVISILFFSAFTKWRYPIVWSYLIFISYVNYSYVEYYENIWWIGLEYCLLLLFIILETKNKFIKDNVSIAE